MKLEIKNIQKSYKSKVVLSDFTSTLLPGIHGILGDNGAGKTTLMCIICNLLDCEEGEVCLDNRSLKEWGSEFYNILGYLPQKLGYYPEFTVNNYLNYICSLKDLCIKQSKAKISELLQIMNLEDKLNDKIKSLSGGMKQRLGIVQAFLNDPKILILDEPTVGLDPNERAHFRNYISSLQGDRIILISTHLVSDIEYIADNILIMQKGKLLYQGNVTQILASVEGNLWTCEVTSQELVQLREKYYISNLNQKKDKNFLRLITEEKPMASAEKVEATLEDAYFYYTSQRRR